MLKQVLFLLISAFLCPASPADARTANTEHAVTVKETPRGYILAVDALAEPLENLLRDLGDQCRIHITCLGRCRLLQPVSIHFQDLTLEQAIKKLIRAAGIKNYLIRYSDGDNGHQSITEVVVFGNSAMATAAFNHSGTLSVEKQHEPRGDLNPPAAAGDEYSKKIASLKDRYRWEDEETRAWAVHLLDAMPDEVKDFGLDVIMKELDKTNEPGRTAVVNAELFYRAIEAAAPPGAAPAMMRQVRRLSEQYHNSEAHGKADTACNGF
jgi:hypothetical protein